MVASTADGQYMLTRPATAYKKVYSPLAEKAAICFEASRAGFLPSIGVRRCLPACTVFDLADVYFSLKSVRVLGGHVTCLLPTVSAFNNVQVHHALNSQVGGSAFVSQEEVVARLARAKVGCACQPSPAAD